MRETEAAPGKASLRRMTVEFDDDGIGKLDPGAGRQLVLAGVFRGVCMVRFHRRRDLDAADRRPPGTDILKEKPAGGVPPDAAMLARDARRGDDLYVDPVGAAATSDGDHVLPHD